MYYVHVLLKLKSGVTSSINLEASQGHVLFFLLYWTVVMFFDSYQLTTFLLKVYHRKHECLFFFNFQHWNNFSVLLNEKQSMCLVSDDQNTHKCQNMGWIPPRMWHPSVTGTATESLHVGALLMSASRTTAAAKTFSNTCQERLKQSVYRVWMEAGRLWVACQFCHPGTSQQTDSGPHQSQTDRQCCGIYLEGKINSADLNITPWLHTVQQIFGELQWNSPLSESLR